MSVRRPSAGDGRSAAWPALGSSVVLRVCDAGALATARVAAERELSAVDAACSRFRDDSELVAVNARAGAPVRVSELLFEALELALRAAELTGGAVDPALGRELELVGYDRDWPAMSRRPVPLEPPPAVHIRRARAPVVLDRATRSVKFPAGVALDVGATAKAWVADRAALAAAAATGCGVLVAVGGDVATAGSPPAGGWPVHVTDDHRSGAQAPGQTVTIETGGLATSSTTVRRWQRGGHTAHHILDPATGRPAREHWRTVSAAAATCADANIAATASIVRGAGAERWLAELRLPARLVRADGDVTCVAGWPSDEQPGRAAA